MIFIHPTLLPVLTQTSALLGVSDSEGRRFVIMSYADHDRADEKGVIGDEWTRLSQPFGQGKLPSEELFTGDQVHDTTVMCYSPVAFSSTPVFLSRFDRGLGSQQGRRGTTHNNLVLFLAAYRAYFEKDHPKTAFTVGVLPYYHIAGYTPFRFCPEARILVDRIIIRLALCLLFDIFVRVPQVVMNRFPPHLFPQIVEKYKISMRRPEC
ncbi:hypothetical protein BS47DRAFT_1487832 [Hydnum rufescens UP504]|uniref:Uncharacterized protein n=1 Tax=Hydnum rufescens UP504 TaxID=1448309 RepID=A0A9P6DP77_9AGAM|nr:hypothetical protein BS47DRAFT_1487832 [Hydnum rufescens UP504]